MIPTSNFVINAVYIIMEIMLLMESLYNLALKWLW